MVVLKGPLLDPDGMDNAQTSEELYVNGTGYADDEVDNERFGLSASMYYLRDGISAQTDPVQNGHYRGYQRGLWKDGIGLSHGGTGHTFAPGATSTLFAFPGDTDPEGLGTGGVPQDPWFAELTSGMTDPRALANMGPKTLDPGAYNTLLVAYVFARSDEADPLASVAVLQQRVDSIRAFAEEIPGMFTTGDNASLPCTNIISGVRERHGTSEALSLFPNPVNEVLVVRTEAFAPGVLMLIHDAQGHLVGQFTSTGDLTRFDVSDLGAGLYTLHVLGGEARSAGRFIKE
ncbi:MAG: T9SS type A sorting domain-containing protein [Flavobacteriales bacterium]|nr:T9SS type A sorting domain-containing protein [Flavobacteriales bacterium]